MLISRFIPILTVAVTTLLFTACGGGGSGGTTSNVLKTSSSSTTQTLSSSPASSSSQSPPLDRANTTVIASAYLDLLSFAKETAVTIVNGEYQAGLPDGTYKDNCDGGSGSFDITVSNNGNSLIQKYNNCLLPIDAEGKTDSLLLSGEESIITTHNENGPSIVNITWKNYTVKNNGEPPLAIDGSFVYEGLLNFNSQIMYKNVTARIKINARVNDEGETLHAKNVDFVFDYPAIFDLYEGAGFGYATKPDVLHIFTQKIATAKGSLLINGVGANFSLNTIDQKVTFSNEGIAKSYLDGEPKGFFIQWDKDNDALMDASIYLTETEYPAILDQADAENNSIYYTRYLNDYGTPYPTNHPFTGQYRSIDLSRGATAEIDVRELFTNKSGALLTYEINNESVSKDWEQIEAGRFLLKFPDSNGTEIYKLNITAVDFQGNRSPVIMAGIRMNDNLADTDKDGTLDIQDPDIDNDGVQNDLDKFPKDASERYDMDDDRIGDNTDTDNDNDGIENASDAYPADSACHKQESGDTLGCYLNNARYSFTDKNQIAYFIQRVGASDVDKMRLVRFDFNTNTYLSPSPVIDLSDGYTNAYAYNRDHHKIILINHLTQKLFILHLDDYSLQLVRSTEGNYVYPYFSDQGYFLLAVTPDQSNARWIDVYDNNGQLVDSSQEEALVEPNNTIYYELQRSEGVHFCQFSISINETGTLIKTGDVDKRLEDICTNSNQVSASGLYAFSTYEDRIPVSIYNRELEKVIDILGFSVQWLGDKLVYQEQYSYDLIIQNPIDQTVKRLSNQDLENGKITVEARKIIITRDKDYKTPALLKIYDENLQLIYDSKNH